MKITNFSFDTSRLTDWPSFDEMFKITRTLREKKYTHMQVCTAMTPKNAETVRELVKIAVLAVFPYNHNYFFNLALTQGLPLSGYDFPFNHPHCFLIGLTKKLFEEYKAHEEFYRNAADAHNFTVNKIALENHIQEKYLIHQVEFEAEKKPTAKAKEQEKAA